jgi:hypothetical protein
MKLTYTELSLLLRALGFYADSRSEDKFETRQILKLMRIIVDNMYRHKDADTT